MDWLREPEAMAVVAFAVNVMLGFMALLLGKTSARSGGGG